MRMKAWNCRRSHSNKGWSDSPICAPSTIASMPNPKKSRWPNASRSKKQPCGKNPLLPTNPEANPLRAKRNENSPPPSGQPCAWAISQNPSSRRYWMNGPPSDLTDILLTLLPYHYTLGNNEIRIYQGKSSSTRGRANSPKLLSLKLASSNSRERSSGGGRKRARSL
jgi:hypothetical protein